MLKQEIHIIVEDLLSEFIKIHEEFLDQNCIAYFSEIVDEVIKRRPQYDEHVVRSMLETIAII